MARTAFVKGPFAVNHDKVLDSQTVQQLANGRAGSAAPVDDTAGTGDIFFDKAQSAQYSGTGNDGRTMLIIVENRDLAALDQLRFDLIAFR